MPYGGVPTAREIINAKLADGSLQAMYRAADTEKSIREALGISESVWKNMKKEIQPLQALSTRTRKEKFLKVKDAMLKNALGYEYEETRIEEEIRDMDGKVIGHKEIVTRHKTPDYNSARVIMANIKSAEKNQANPDPEIVAWTNKPEEALEIKAEGGINLLLDASVQSVLEALSGN